MQCHTIIRWSLSLIFFATLTACGGGGDGGGGSNVNVGGGSTMSGGEVGSSRGVDGTLTATQQAVQDIYAEANNGIYFFGGNLPSAGTPINSSVHFLTATQYSISGLLSDQPQILKRAVSVVAGSLSVAPPVQTFRVLVNGSFFGGIPISSPAVTERLSLIDGDVLSELTENGVVLSAVRLSFGEAVPLTGAIAASPSEVRTSLAGLISLPSALRPGATYLPGAMYYKRKQIREHDSIVIDNDCLSFTTVVPPEPAACGTVAKIEDVFTYVSPFGGLKFTDGTIQTLQGLRLWVATNPLPTTAEPAPTVLVFVERAGRVYKGTLQRRGQRGDSLRFNKQAVDSLKAAVTF